MASGQENQQNVPTADSVRSQLAGKGENMFSAPDYKIALYLLQKRRPWEIWWPPKVACSWSHFSSSQTALALCLGKPLKERCCRVCSPFHLTAHSGPWGLTPNRSNSARDKEEGSNNSRCIVWKTRDFLGPNKGSFMLVCLSVYLMDALGVEHHGAVFTRKVVFWWRLSCQFSEANHQWW